MDSEKIMILQGLTRLFISCCIICTHKMIFYYISFFLYKMHLCGFQTSQNDFPILEVALDIIRVHLIISI